ncbi:iron complex outermembrane recepter protein [Sphingomonas laterariae]|uniref:Iron complex outermembrane recepter protein n=1 Tax=Edaphosphingomonas laterariae TaxID=861865 RepID=A0A239HC15_9SPHN|nr:TonB-dependent receptor [Sphingomonas laterariae]SNS78705.1 iron complex outermembrane recepter protein [Sphingomonas laterariae]
MPIRRDYKTKLGFHIAASATALALIAPSPAQAGDAAAPAEAAGPEAAAGAELLAATEILVTARRREERAQDVPIALNAIGADTLERTGTFTINQVQQLVPSLQVFSFNPRNTNINIRGLGSNVALTNDGLENGVGVYVDQVYYGRVGTSQFDLVDLDRIEVLRGPQGTLFGKNTTAGAINISSRLPSFTPEFSGELSLGDRGYHQVRGSASAPLIDDKLAFRLSIADTHRDGFLDNVRTGRKAQDYDNFSVRGQLLATPTEALSIRLIADFSRQRLNCCIGVIADVFTAYDNGSPIPNSFADRVTRAGYTPLPADPFARKTDADSDFHADMYGYGFSGQIDWDLGPVALTSITAYRRWHWNPANDGDSIGLPIITLAEQANRQRQFSQELRIASTGENIVDYVAGLYYFDQTVNGYGATGYGPAAPNWFLPTVPAALGNAALNGFVARSTSTPQTKSYAAFAQATWNATDALSVTAGLRFTHEDKTGTYTQVQEGADLSALPPALAAAAQQIRNSFGPATDYTARRKDDSLSGTINIAYKIAPDVLGYATYSRGNKSGGLNLAALPPGVPTTVKPEKVNNYEIGIKSEFLDRQVTLNLAAFWTDVGNYQTAILDMLPSSVTFVQYIANAGKVRSRGVEADAAYAPNDLISFTASAAYTDAEYRDYPNGPAPVESGLAVADLSGQPLAGVPKFTYALGADVAQPIGSVQLYGHADYSHRSSFYTAVSNSRFSKVDGYGLVNLRVGVRSEDRRWDASLWTKNLFDKDYFQTLTPGNTGLVTGLTGDPRTVGATLRTSF